MTDVHVVKVFIDDAGKFGDTATIIFDEGRGIMNEARVKIAGDLDAVETVFVNNTTTCQVSFVHSQGEIDFAGVPALGAAWLLAEMEGRSITRLEGRGGEILVSQEDGLTWVRTNLDAMPAWNYLQLADSTEVDRISLSKTTDWEHTMVWAWIDEMRGIVRARTFATDWDIPEAQGNGSGSMLLAANLNRVLEIRHGLGSVIYARPSGDGFADIGGRVSQETTMTI